MREAQRRTIYNNYDLWGDYEEFARETLSEYDENPSDDAIWNVINDEDAFNWDCEKERLEDFFNDGSTWILRGTNGRWNGTFEAGTIFTDFMEMFREVMTDCDYVHMYDENGNDWNDRRTEEYIHDRVMERYSTLPHFAHTVYGCPKVEYKKVAA